MLMIPMRMRRVMPPMMKVEAEVAGDQRVQGSRSRIAKPKVAVVLKLSVRWEEEEEEEAVGSRQYRLLL
jgi:hypothetical protein